MGEVGHVEYALMNPLVPGRVRVCASEESELGMMQAMVTTGGNKHRTSSLL